jgi:HNH endonuclease
MPRRRRISAAVRRQITARDTQRCAYCRSPMIVGIPMVIEHIIPLVSGGSSTPDNLCLACYRCNEFKGSRTEAADPRDGQLTPFFHPRRQRWSEHFAWSEHGDTMAGLTSCGRTTIAALRLNNDWIVQARRLWMLAGLHPPLEL